MSAQIAMIAAVARNGVIGSAQTIPWRIPSDFAYFRDSTMGKPIVMGRKQYDTVGRPLPGRTNIVITRRQDFGPPGVIVVPTLEAALTKAAEIAGADDVDEIMVIGGGEIYRQLMDRADRLYISHVELEPEGDVLFPPIDPEVWVVVDEPDIAPSADDEAAYRVKVYARR
ncbi:MULTISPECIES: dihydrofolate reductase [unclassified Devosia]|uniref:dihydrofolate reductase n=1 Tax=unclassified Devosia TaxID=196773 RepID=UPI001556969D|nr:MULTISPECIES: dihydrofolate reductase [unclassified Devosia]